MEATHDIDFALWCLAPRKPVRVYAQEVRKIMGAQYNVPDCVWIVVTMDDGVVFTIGAGWVLPPAYPNFSSTWIEFVGTEKAAMADDTHRDVYVTTMQHGIQFPFDSDRHQPDVLDLLHGAQQYFGRAGDREAIPPEQKRWA